MSWSRFEYRAVSLFSLHRARNQSVFQEFDRVGLTNVQPFMSAPSPYDARIEGSIPHSRMCSGSFLSATLKHQQMCRAAFETGAKTGLFFENDVRFLKDLDQIEFLLSELPKDFDVALLDWVPRQKVTPKELSDILEKQTGPWRRFKDARSCAAYALSRRGMERYLKVLENPARKIGKLKICDQHWWDILQSGELRGYLAVPNIAVQGVAGGLSNSDKMWAKYRSIFVKREDYAE